MAKKLSDMTPAEREQIIREACAKMQVELEQNAPIIAQILEDTDASSNDK